MPNKQVKTCYSQYDHHQHNSKHDSNRDPDFLHPDSFPEQAVFRFGNILDLSPPVRNPPSPPLATPLKQSRSPQIRRGCPRCLAFGHLGFARLSTLRDGPAFVLRTALRMTIVKTSTSYFACTSPATTAATLSSIWFQPSTCPLFFALSIDSFPIKVSFVWPFPKSSKVITSCAPSMAS